MMETPNSDQQTAQEIRDYIAGLPEELQQRVKLSKHAMQMIIRADKEAGVLALASLGAEVAAL